MIRNLTIPLVCSSLGQLSYSCDFEMYGACALEQDDKDTFDWLPRVVDQQSFNAPDADHTTGIGRFWVQQKVKVG